MAKKSTKLGVAIAAGAGATALVVNKTKKSGKRQCSSHISERRHAYQIPSSKKKPSKRASWEWLVSYHILP